MLLAPVRKEIRSVGCKPAVQTQFKVLGERLTLSTAVSWCQNQGAELRNEGCTTS